ncbi:MAG: response regulator [Pleurocapsa sp. MO_192.B19]|nr:response regulator [Pleurocapsa sp. MO_192.B19]
MTQKSDPAELLVKSSNLNHTGCWEFTKNSVSWKVYLQEGKLTYTDCSIQLLTQLQYYLLRQGWKDVVAALKDLPKSDFETKVNPDNNPFPPSFYEHAIVWLLNQKHLDNSQFIQLIEDLTQDALQSCLWIMDGSFVWHEGQSVPSWIKAQVGTSLSLDILDLVDFLEKRLGKWQKCASKLNSPHQRPYFMDYRDIEKPLASGVLSSKVLNELAQIMRRGLSFRQLSLFLHKDELHVAQILSPYIEHKMIHLRNPPSPLDQLPKIPKTKSIEENKNFPPGSVAIKKYKIACIDDSPIILQEIQRFLDRDRFEVTAIDDPVQASSVIFRLEPNLILLDITMPRINGYKLCGLLRSSNIFNETPIIMVTGNTGMIDKARAKLAGATDYFTKPFTKEGLMEIIEKHLK